VSWDLGSSVVTALESSNVPCIVFVEMDFGSGFVRVTNAPYTFTWNGYSWIGLGALGGIDSVEEGANLEARGVALRLSGVPIDGEGDSENIAIALGEHYQGRDCRIWVAILNDSFSIIDSPKLLFVGRMDNMEIEIGQTATIVLKAESRLADLERPRVRRYNGADQKDVYPTDLGLDFVEQVTEMAILWGKV
jgi:hypothetical protein